MIPTPTLRQMRGFVTVARMGSFSRAAAELGMSQSALSQAIQQLEFLLDVTLLERRFRSVAVTSAGERFVFRIERILRDVTDAVESVRYEAQSEAGRVSVACQPTLAAMVMPAAVRHFKSNYPNVTVVVHGDCGPDDLKAGATDFAITHCPRIDCDFAFEPLIHDRLRFVCHNDHVLSQRRSVRWQDLDGIDLVALAAGSRIRHIVSSHLPHGSALDHATYEVPDEAAALRAVEDGEFSSVLPALSLAEVRIRAPLSHLPVTDPFIEREIGLLTPLNSRLSTIAEHFRLCFIDALRTWSEQSPMVDVTVLPSESEDMAAAR